MGLAKLALAVTLLAGSTSAHAAPPVEVLNPQGKADGIVLTMHGGGWLSADELGGGSAAELMEPWTRRLTAAGFRVVNVDYHSGALSLVDALASFDWAAHRWPEQEICALGFSSGGHLALALDLEGREPACIVSVSGPTNLRHSSPPVEALAAASFDGRLGELSPALHPNRIDAPAMLVAARCDEEVPFAGQRRAARSLDAKFVAVAAGEDGRPLHCPTSASSYGKAMAEEVGFVSRQLGLGR